MLRSFALRSVAGCGLVWLAGCTAASPRLLDIGHDLRAIREVTAMDALWPATAAFLETRPELPRRITRAAGLSMTGGHALYGMTLRMPEGDVQWLIRVLRQDGGVLRQDGGQAATSQPTDGKRRLLITWFGPFHRASTQPVMETLRQIDVTPAVLGLRVNMLTEGLARMATRVAPTDAMEIEQSHGTHALIALLTACFSMKKLSSLAIEKVINKPGFFDQVRLFFSLGSRPNAEAIRTNCVRVHADGLRIADTPRAFRAMGTEHAALPIDLVAASTHVLRVWIRTALGASGGGLGSTLLSVEGFHPDDPGRGLVIWLIGNDSR